MEPPHTYLLEPSGSVAHHADYLNVRADYALCGVVFQDPAAVTKSETADAVCPDCEAQLVVYHLKWWREKAETATAELEALRAKYGETAPVAAEVEDIQVAAVIETASSEDTTFLARARREVTGLCQQFEGTVPFYRLKNAMQDFSDTLTDDERLLLAQEVGSDSSLIRWATIEVETLGMSVKNNRVQENNDSMMWQEWLEEAQQAPAPAKAPKKRFGRSR